MTVPAVTETDLIEGITDAFIAAMRGGQRPLVQEYLEQYPDLAGELAELLPAIVLLEQHAAFCESQSNDPFAMRPALPAHQEIGDFTIVREVGRGGMGIVYEAMQ